MPDDRLDAIYDIIEDISVAMMVTETRHDLRSRPMKVHLDRETGELWSLTKISSGKIRDIKGETHINLAFSCPKTQKYVSVSGHAKLSRAPAKIHQLWNDDTEAWFGCEEGDPEVAAVCTRPLVIEYWSGRSSSAVRMWELVKSKMTDKTPEMGDNETVYLAR